MSPPRARPPSTPVAGTGTVSGSIEMAAGGKLPANLHVTLHGFDHGQDANSGPQEVLTLSGTAAADGSYAFDNVAMPSESHFPGGSGICRALSIAPASRQPRPTQPARVCRP